MSDDVFVVEVEWEENGENRIVHTRGVFTTLDAARRAILEMAEYAAQQQRLRAEWNARRTAYLDGCTPWWISPPSSFSNEPVKDYKPEDVRAAEDAAGPKPETVKAGEWFAIYRLKLNQPAWELEEVAEGRIDEPSHV